MTVPQTSTSQLLTFTIEAEKYAIPVSIVLEVLEYKRIVRLPRRAEWLRGLIDVRGQIIAVVDLKQRFGMSSSREAQDAAIIVVELPRGGELQRVGFLADAVHEVIEIDAAAVEEAPRIGTHAATEFLTGIGRAGDSFLLLLDLSRLLGDVVSEAVEAAAGEVPAV